MYTFIKKFGNSNLRIFCNNSYSIELFFVLLTNNENNLGVEEIYNKITLPKPKQSTFNVYIKLLVDKNFIKVKHNIDKRKKTLILSDKSLIEYKKLEL